MGRGSGSPWNKSPARNAHADLWSIGLLDVAAGFGKRASTSGTPGTTSDSRNWSFGMRSVRLNIVKPMSWLLPTRRVMVDLSTPRYLAAAGAVKYASAGGVSP